MSSVRFLLLAFLVACGGGVGDDLFGLSEDEFADAFVTKYCEVWSECNTSGDACPLERASTTTTGTSTCESYDSSAAQDCVDGEFECDTQFGAGLEMVIPPEVCSYICQDTSTTGGTSVYTGTTTSS